MNPIAEYKQTYKEDFLDLNSPDLSKSKDFIEICCPKCDNPIPAKDLNIDDKLAKCSSCNVVFAFEKEIALLKNEHRKTRQRILRPEGIEMFHFNDELDLSFKDSVSPVEQFVILGIMFLSLIVAASLSKMGLTDIVIGSPIVISFLAAGIYFIIRDRQLKYIKVNSKELRIMKYPNVFKKTEIYHAGDIGQLYVKHDSSSSNWKLMMLVDEGDGQKHVKLTQVKTASKAKFLEQEIESYLNIEDVIVPEETS